LLPAPKPVLPRQLIDVLAPAIHNMTLRKALGLSSPALFGAIYFSKYFFTPLPDFHLEIYGDLQDEYIKFLEIIGFRGSAKSTIAALIFVVWCAVFKKRHFIILVSDTFEQAKLLISNIIAELEDQESLLHKDFGDIYKKEKEKGEKKNEWRATSIVLTNDVRIIARSRGQKVRGLRHKQFRPDLIVVDDFENSDDVQSQEQRDKDERWLLTELLPALDTEIGKFVMLANLLHQDSVASRLKRKILSGKIKGILHEFSLFDENNVNRWPEKFTPEIIKELEGRGLIYYMREYLLKIVAPDGQPVKKIHKYLTLPRRSKETDPQPLQRIAIGVDLAISKKQTADFTSINVAAMGLSMPIYNLENIAGRWGFNDALKEINRIFLKYRMLYPWCSLTLGVENVQYQQAAIEQLQTQYKLPAIGIKPTMDKKANLETYAPFFDSQQVLFPDDGTHDAAESEIVNFGTEPHDDRMDAVLLSIKQLVNVGRPSIHWI